MVVKDYYKILELPPQASISEVKKNFRRLALRYHPDTNAGNRYAEAWYREIQEAYQTLTNDALREAYHHQRWLLKSQGRPFAATMPLTPAFILKQCFELKEQVNNMDHFRMSHEALQQQALFVVNDENITALTSYNEIATNKLFVQTIIDALYPLDYKLLAPILLQLEKLSFNDRTIQQTIQHYKQKRKKQFVWERYQAIFFLAITILLCALIYWVGK